MRYRVGRFLQLLGLVIMPVGIAGNLVRPGEVGTREELGILLAGLAVFGVGWLVQRQGPPH